MNKTLESSVTNAYKKLYALYFGRASIEAAGLQPGMVSVLIRDQPGFSAQGTLNPIGGLSGMSRAYAQLKLLVGDTVECEAMGQSQLVITNVVRPAARSAAPEVAPPPQPPQESVFQRQQLKPIHIELFSPENLNRWEPENEPDVYMAFGVLQEYTRYRYCCATSKQLLDHLGFKPETKPDAILVDDETSEYVVAEFKMLSSAFVGNHKPTDVDVLIVWDHDEHDADKLPPQVVCLREIAREAAQELLQK